MNFGDIRALKRNYWKSARNITNRFLCRTYDPNQDNRLDWDHPNDLYLHVYIKLTKGVLFDVITYFRKAILI